MRRRPYVLFFLGPVVAYLVVLFLVALYIAKPSGLGWIGFGVAAAVGLSIGTAASFIYPRSRTEASRRHPRLGDQLRLLLVADRHCEESVLCAAVQREVADRPAEVLVLAPVLPPALHFLTDVEENDRDDARARLTESLQALARLGIEAKGTLGSDDPLQAIGDALAGFDANEILVVRSERAERSFFEYDLERKARDAYGIHVATVTVDRDRVEAVRG